MSEQQKSPSSPSCLGRALKIVGTAALAVGLIYFLATINFRSLGLPIGEWPRVPFYVYTTSKVTLTFDGEEITIEGTTRCRRRIEMDEDGDLRPLVFLDHFGFIYYCGPEWFGHRFEDGSALLVGAYSNSGAWRSALSAFLGGLPAQPHFEGNSLSTQLSNVPPAVVWLDDAEAPLRAEYYYSTAALKDPRSRLTAIQHEAEMWPASLWTSAVTGRSASDHSHQVPALVEPSSLYRMVGHFAVELSADDWSTIEGLKQALAGLSTPTLLRPPEQISETLFERVSAMVLRQVQPLPPRFMRHGVASVPLEVAGTESAGRPSGFSAPVRSVVPDPGKFHTFHFDDDVPNGVLSLSARTAGQMSDTATLVLGDTSVSAPYRLMWFGGLLYDPTANAIHNLRVVGF